jgi:hypothetical protein
MSHRQALTGLLPKTIRESVGEVRAVAVASGTGGAWINDLHVVAKPACLPILWSAGRRSGQRETESAWTTQYPVRMAIRRYHRRVRARAYQGLHREGASREVRRSRYLHSHADATRSSAGSAD